MSDPAGPIIPDVPVVAAVSEAAASVTVLLMEGACKGGLKCPSDPTLMHQLLLGLAEKTSKESTEKYKMELNGPGAYTNHKALIQKLRLSMTQILGLPAVHGPIPRNIKNEVQNHKSNFWRTLLPGGDSGPSVQLQIKEKGHGYLRNLFIATFGANVKRKSAAEMDNKEKWMEAMAAVLVDQINEARLYAQKEKLDAGKPASAK